MNVSEAVKAAKVEIASLFQDEGIEDVGLEEVSKDDSGHWKITIGFSRPWNKRPTLSQAISGSPLLRTLKVVKISDEDGKIVSVSNWPVVN